MGYLPPCSPKPIWAAPRGNSGEREASLREQAAGLSSALHFSMKMATGFSGFAHPTTPTAFPTLPSLTLTTCRVLVMKAFLMPSSVASRLNLRGFASTMRKQQVKESPLVVVDSHTDTQPPAVPPTGTTMWPLHSALSQTLVWGIQQSKTSHGRDMHQCEVPLLRFLGSLMLCSTVRSVQMNTRLEASLEPDCPQ